MFPRGRAERSALRVVIASPSGSVAPTETVTSDASDPLTVAGAATAGGAPEGNSAIANESTTLPGVHVASLVPPPVGPQMKLPWISEEVKRSRSAPRCIARNADHAGCVHASQRQLPSSSKLAPPVPAVM